MHGQRQWRAEAWVLRALGVVAAALLVLLAHAVLGADRADAATAESAVTDVTVTDGTVTDVTVVGAAVTEVTSADATVTDVVRADASTTATGEQGTADQGSAAAPEGSSGADGTSDPGTTDPGTSDPGTSDPGTSDPGTSDPGTTDPGTSEPGTSDPTASPDPAPDPAQGPDPATTPDPGTPPEGDGAEQDPAGDPADDAERTPARPRPGGSATPGAAPGTAVAGAPRPPATTPVVVSAVLTVPTGPSAATAVDASVTPAAERVCRPQAPAVRHTAPAPPPERAPTGDPAANPLPEEPAEPTPPPVVAVSGQTPWLPAPGPAGSKPEAPAVTVAPTVVAPAHVVADTSDDVCAAPARRPSTTVPILRLSGRGVPGSSSVTPRAGPAPSCAPTARSAVALPASPDARTRPSATAHDV